MEETLKDKTFTQATDDLTVNNQRKNNAAMAAATVHDLLKIRKQTIRESLELFHGVEHRLEHVLKVKNVKYINDSKATNINATYYALNTIKAKIVWIVGANHAVPDFDELLPLVHEKVKAIICLGVDNSEVIKSFDNCIDLMYETKSMNEAVQMAYQLAEGGDSVLLSPGCESFELFENYKERGRQFKEMVRHL